MTLLGMARWWCVAMVLLVISLIAGEAYKAHIIKVADTAGYARANGEWKGREADITEEARKHAQQETDRTHADTAALQEKFDTLADTRQKEKTQHEEDKRTAVTLALAGVERMRIPTTSGAIDPVRDAGNSQGATARTGIATAPPAYLLPETVAAILDIAGDYGQLVRDYNTVVDRYSDIERACNRAGRKVSTTTAPPPQGE
jgi:Tfp pilus assembly major pilin PilA